MEAKDAVMSDEEIKDKQIAGEPWELWRLRKVAETQAEISFPLGEKQGYDKALAQLAGMTEECKQMGRGEVVEWMKKNNHNEGIKAMFYLSIPLEKWQAKLKEWGMKQEGGSLGN